MDFKSKVVKSFRKSKKDINEIKVYLRGLNAEHQMLKKSANEWIMYLMKENEQLKARIKMLEEQAEERDIFSTRSAALA